MDKFFMRHPDIEELQYIGKSSLCSVCTLSSLEILPNLIHYYSSNDDIVHLSNSSAQPLEDIVVKDTDLPWCRNSMHQALADLPHIKQLVLRNPFDMTSGYTILCAVDLMRSCPSLAHLDLSVSVNSIVGIGVNPTTRLALFFVLLVNGLPALTHLVFRVDHQHISHFKHVASHAIAKAVHDFDHQFMRQIKFKLHFAHASDPVWEFFYSRKENKLERRS
ncbi:hypothetical protein GYMLUDRAFT_245315 [Collybiopsis luxurians FD-317 M1]|uniref:Uncharacterized protein n=1 Tax=Collybiopsis luxurians FD-317 M1 TaxID=944289 RepID=A0A0D0BUQ8_9AGAR|nr:hypothetical protein GYMLUDRAFT_245315 [Collybiopsis luxurians FD-317 M1]